MPTTPKLEQTPSSGSYVQRLVQDLRKGWTPFPMEIDPRMNEAADVILRLQSTEDAFALALATHVSVTQWGDVISTARKIQSDPKEWESRNLTPPIHLLNAQEKPCDDTAQI